MSGVRVVLGVETMNAMLLLTVLTSVGVLALFVALALFLMAISGQLEAIGGTPTSRLAKIRFGLRAIEMETGNLAPGVTRLNAELSAVRDGLGIIDENLGGVITAVSQQESS